MGAPTEGEAMDELLSEDEVAARLKVARGTLRTWRNRGQGPAFVKAGDLLRYRVADVQAWVESRRVVPSQKVATP